MGKLTRDEGIQTLDLQVQKLRRYAVDRPHAPDRIRTHGWRTRHTAVRSPNSEVNGCTGQARSLAPSEERMN